MIADPRLRHGLPRWSYAMIAVAAAILACVPIRPEVRAQESPLDLSDDLREAVDQDPEIANPSWRLLHLIHPAHRNSIWNVAFSPDGKTIASAACDKTTRLWDTATGEPLAILKGHEAEVRTVAFAPDGDLLLSTSDDQTARFWDTRTFEQVTVMRGHEGQVLCGAFAPDGRQVVTAGKTSGGQIVLLRDVPSGDWGDMRLLPAQTTQIMSVAFSPDGDMLAIVGDYSNFQIWKRSGRGPQGPGETEK